MSRSSRKHKFKKLRKFLEKYHKEITFLLAQIAVFYILPLFASSFGEVSTAFIILIFTFAVAVLCACFLNKKIKYLYPVLTPALFIPSVFIYYNSSALVNALWYAIMYVLGFAVGLLIRKVSGKAYIDTRTRRKIKKMKERYI